MTTTSFFLKLFLVLTVFSHVLCTEQESKNQAMGTQSVVQTPDSTRSNTFATAQIMLNIETFSGHQLAYANLDLCATANKVGKYKVKTLLIDDGNTGPFSNFAIIDKAVITKNNQIKVIISYELQTQRINWEAKQGLLTGVYGDSPFKEALKSGGGAMSCTATLIFDDKNMVLLSQNSSINERLTINANNKGSVYKDWNEFALKYLKIRLGTNIHWMNEACLNAQAACTTGVIYE